MSRNPIKRISRFIPRLHPVTWFAIFLAIVTLTLIAVPGVSSSSIAYSPPKTNQMRFASTYIHGWPFACAVSLRYPDDEKAKPESLIDASSFKRSCQQQIPSDSLMSIESVPMPRDGRVVEQFVSTFPKTDAIRPEWLQPWCWPIGAARIQLYPRPLLFNLLIGLVIILVIAVGVELAIRLHFKKKGFRFRLAHLFVMVIIVSLVAVTIVNMRTQLKNDVSLNEQLIFDSYLRTAESPLLDQKLPIVLGTLEDGPNWLRPFWLRKLIGNGWDTTLIRVRSLQIGDKQYHRMQASAAQIKKLNQLTSQLPCVERIELYHLEPLNTGVNLECLDRCKELTVFFKWEWTDPPTKFESLCPNLNRLHLELTSWNAPSFNEIRTENFLVKVSKSNYSGNVSIEAFGTNGTRPLSLKSLNALYAAKFRSIQLHNCVLESGSESFVRECFRKRRIEFENCFIKRKSKINTGLVQKNMMLERFFPRNKYKPVEEVLGD